MNAKHIDSKFAAMNARLKVREIPSRWQMGDRKWIDPVDYALDIRRDGNGEFFEFRVPTHLRDSLEATVVQTEPKERHLLLMVRKTADQPQLDRFLCGHDEREWFVAAVPGGASSVRQAMDALQPRDVRESLTRTQEPSISPSRRVVLRARTIVGGGQQTCSPQRTASPWCRKATFSGRTLP